VDITVGLSPAGWRWINTLFTSLAFSLMGIAAPNFFKQTSDSRRRSHNGVKFLNEFLARQLLLYVTFFMALALTAELRTAVQGVKVWVTFVVSLTLVGYLFGVYLSTVQDRFFRDHHNCEDLPGCSVPIKRKAIWKLCKFNAAMAGVLFVLSVIAAFMVK
jgi:magnesium-transporting ATPase (P-type)